MQLAITVIGDSQLDLMHELSSIIQSNKCSIAECKMSSFSNDAAAILLVTGNWNHIARLETSLDSWAKKANYALHFQQTESSSTASRELFLPYAIEACGQDRDGIINELSEFLRERGILIQDMNASTQPALYTKVQLCTINILVLVPTEVALISLRDEFLEFCDRLNIDAMIDPVKR